LRFEGEADAPRSEGARELALELAFAAGEARFKLARVFRYLVKRREGTPPPDVRVLTTRLDLGAVWIDSSVTTSLVVKGDPDRPVKVLVASSWARARELALGAGEEKRLEVTIDPAKLEAAETRLKLRAEVTLVATATVRPHARGERTRPDEAPPPAPPRLLSVPVACEARALRVASSFDLGSVKQGEAS